MKRTTIVKFRAQTGGKKTVYVVGQDVSDVGHIKQGEALGALAPAVTKAPAQPAPKAK